MELKPGAKLGPYEITAALGRGGMGEVWKAFDPRLNREVAIKTYHAGFNGRFRTEALAVAALNHPNICTLHDVGPDYLVMEHIDGVTLAERLSQGPIPLAEALGIAKQIADALEAAHDKGIVHRDLKPANIKIRTDGSVKVLDFGLAKAAEQQEVTPDSPTLPATQTGAIMGTTGYMSPEQARGQKVDKRADIWAFGVVFYEMVSGRRLFDEPTVSDALVAILTKPLDLTAAPEKTRRLLGSCLERDTKKRLRDVGDWALLLDEPRAAGEAAASTGEPSSRRARWVWAAVVLLLAAAAIAGWWPASSNHNMENAGPLRLSVLPPDDMVFEDLSKDSGGSAISPDGRTLVFVARQSGKSLLFVRALDTLEAKPLRGTEGAAFPFWSPDSRTVGFFAGHKLEKIALAATGTAALPEIISGDAVARGGSWNQDDRILFTPPTQNALEIVSSAGGPATAATVLNASAQETAHLWPQFLPDGKHFIYFVKHTQPRNDGIFVSSLGEPGKTGVRLTGAASTGWYVPENGRWEGSQRGYLLFIRGQTLFAQHFSAKSLRLEDEPVALASGIQTVQAGGAADFSVSRGGAIAYRLGAAMTSHMTWLDRQGRVAGTAGPEGIWAEPRISRDQTSVAVTRADQETGNVDTWLMSFARNVPARFTFWADLDIYPVWSPDGAQIAYGSNRPPVNLFVKQVNGTGEEQRLTTSPNVQRPRDWSRDGRFVLYEESGPANLEDIWILPVSPAGEAFTFLKTPARERQGQFSPAGANVIAYTSDETGRDEVYIGGFDPGGKSPTGKWQVSTSGGAQPRWRADAHELYYLEGNTMMAVAIQPRGAGIEVGTREKLFESRGFSLSDLGADYDVTADGKRFLTLIPARDNTFKPITVLLNWSRPGSAR